IGVDDVDLEAATELGVLVTHSPTEANWGGVAEGTIGLMLALLKKLRERDAAVKAGRWRDPSLYGTYLGARDDGYPGITVGCGGGGSGGGEEACAEPSTGRRGLCYGRPAIGTGGGAGG